MRCAVGAGRYEDDGKLRPILHRGSLVEMCVVRQLFLLIRAGMGLLAPLCSSSLPCMLKSTALAGSSHADLHYPRHYDSA